MSDLQERLIQRAQRNIDDFPTTNSAKSIISDCWPIIEAELQKEQREIARWIRNCQVLIEETNAAHQETLSWKARAKQTYTEWEEANKKIERLEEDVKQYRAMAEAAERERWVDANDYAILKQRVYKLLDQTIEVLGIAIWALDSAELNARIADDEHVRRDVRIGIDKALSELTPLLDNLKALKKEPDVHQQAVAEILAPKPIDHVDGGFKP